MNSLNRCASVVLVTLSAVLFTACGSSEAPVDSVEVVETAPPQAVVATPQEMLIDHLERDTFFRVNERGMAMIFSHLDHGSTGVTLDFESNVVKISSIEGKSTNALLTDKVNRDYRFNRALVGDRNNDGSPDIVLEFSIDSLIYNELYVRDSSGYAKVEDYHIFNEMHSLQIPQGLYASLHREAPNSWWSELVSVEGTTITTYGRLTFRKTEENNFFHILRNLDGEEFHMELQMTGSDFEQKYGLLSETNNFLKFWSEHWPEFVEE